LLDGTPPDEVFREKDERARQRSQAESEGQDEKRAPTPRQPRVGQPSPVNPLNPETT
jgi:hypothetical protein